MRASVSLEQIWQLARSNQLPPAMGLAVCQVLLELLFDREEQLTREGARRITLEVNVPGDREPYTPLPGEELRALVTAVSDACALAGEGRVAAGYMALEHARDRAAQARDAGHPWADELDERCRIALDEYCRHFGPRFD
jgi:hypothetical protein